MARLFAIVGLFVAAMCVSVYAAPGKGKISCKDAKGRDVDCQCTGCNDKEWKQGTDSVIAWFVLYKLPKTRPSNPNFMSLDGYEMLYYDSRPKKGTWTLLDGGINGKRNNPVWETLAPIYKKKDRTVAYVIYNDQLPHGFNGTRGGHTKGILLAGDGEKSGTAWLQHSVPRFLDDVNKEYEYPSSGRENGQLFFCTSTPLKSVNIIAFHLQVQAANIYQTNPAKWAIKYQEFWKILNRDYLRAPKHLRVDFLLTNKKKLVMAIAKPPKWPKDIYTQELGHQMNDSIYVQSWRNGAGGAQNEYCTPDYSVTDITVIGVKTTKGYAVFSSREDHSKWYVTKHKGVFCFSSLNRMLSQMKRGGEITCIIDIPLASLFRNSIAERNTCKNEKAE